MDQVYLRALNELSSEKEIDPESKDFGKKILKYPQFWGNTTENDREFVELTDKFNNEVSEAITLMKPGSERFKLDEQILAGFTAGDTPDKIQYYEREFEGWIKSISALLQDDGDQK